MHAVAVYKQNGNREQRSIWKANFSSAHVESEFSVGHTKGDGCFIHRDGD